MLKVLRFGAGIIALIGRYCKDRELRQYLGQAAAFGKGRSFTGDENLGAQPAAGGPVRPVGALRQIFDERVAGRGIHKWLHYFPAYEQHLAKFVGGEVRLAEVGVFSGGSLEMWHAYFGERCTVYGIDIAPQTKVYEDVNTKIYIGDQGDRGFWRSFKAEVSDLDIFIDDGSHVPKHQILTFEEMFPKLRPGGVYICEDVHGDPNEFTSYVAGLCSRLNDYTPAPLSGSYEFGIVSPTSPWQAMISSVHILPFLIVITKTEAPLAVLEAPRRGSEWQPFYG